MGKPCTTPGSMKPQRAIGANPSNLEHRAWHKEFAAQSVRGRPSVLALGLLALFFASGNTAFGDPLGSANEGRLFGYKIEETYFDDIDFDVDAIQRDGFVRHTVRYRGRPAVFDEVTLKLTPLSHVLVSLTVRAELRNNEDARSCAEKYVSVFRSKYPNWKGGARNNPRDFPGHEDYVVIESEEYWINVDQYENHCVVRFGKLGLSLSLAKLARKERAQMTDSYSRN